MKRRKLYAAGVTLLAAHDAIESLTMGKEQRRFKARVAQEYADLVYNGLWYSQTREAIDALVEKVQERVTGTIRLKLFKGGCHVVGRSSPYALYDHALAPLSPVPPSPIHPIAH